MAERCLYLNNEKKFHKAQLLAKKAPKWQKNPYLGAAKEVNSTLIMSIPSLGRVNVGSTTWQEACNWKGLKHQHNKNDNRS